MNPNQASQQRQGPGAAKRRSPLQRAPFDPLALGMGWGMVPDLLLYWPQWTRESVAAQRLIEPVNTPHTN
ncbi:MAG: hypothetical protein ABIQ90_10160, partial [Polaromonas sp.]